MSEIGTMRVQPPSNFTTDPSVLCLTHSSIIRFLVLNDLGLNKGNCPVSSEQNFFKNCTVFGCSLIHLKHLNSYLFTADATFTMIHSGVLWQQVLQSQGVKYLFYPKLYGLIKLQNYINFSLLIANWLFCVMTRN